MRDYIYRFIPVKSIARPTRLRQGYGGHADDPPSPRLRPTTDDRRPRTGNRQLVTGNWQLATGNR